MLKNQSLFKLVSTSMMCALAVVMMLIVRFSILPNAKFLEYDMGDIPVILATMLINPPAGFIVLFFVSLIQSLTVSAASSWQGFVMHMCSTGCYIVILTLFTYKSDHIKRLIAGLVAATAALTIIMIPLNLIFTPMYLKVPVEAVAQLLLPAIIPFNLIKGIINSLIIVLIYRPIKSILKKNDMLIRY